MKPPLLLERERMSGPGGAQAMTGESLLRMGRSLKVLAWWSS